MYTVIVCARRRARVRYSRPMPLSLQRIQQGAMSTWVIADPDEKLVWRASLPGASCFDRAAHSLRSLQAEGALAVDLLPLALPASWMVNAKATSRAMQRWLSPEALQTWETLLDVIAFTTSPDEWLAFPSARRDAASDAMEALATGEEGASLVAASKVLALLRPQMVPLMDDAALFFALECVPEPKTAEVVTGPASAFLPMLDWFATQVVAQEKALVAMATRHERAILDSAQVLDRLLWVESWGNRLRKR